MSSKQRSDSGLEQIIQDVIGDDGLVEMMREDDLHLRRRLNALAKYLGVANIPGKTWEELNEDVARKWEKMVSTCHADFVTNMQVYEAPLMFQYRDSGGREWCFNIHDILRTAEEIKGWFKTEIVFKNPMSGEKFDEKLVARLRWQLEMLSFIYQVTPASLTRLTDKLARRLDFDDVSMANAKSEAAQRIAIGFAWLSLVAITPSAVMSVPLVLAGGVSVQKYFTQIVRDIVKGSVLNSKHKPTSKVADVVLKTLGISSMAKRSRTETLYDPISALPDREEIDKDEQRRRSSVSPGPTMRECASVCPPCPRRRSSNAVTSHRTTGRGRRRANTKPTRSRSRSSSRRSRGLRRRRR